MSSRIYNSLSPTIRSNFNAVVDAVLSSGNQSDCLANLDLVVAVIRNEIRAYKVSMNMDVEDSYSIYTPERARDAYMALSNNVQQAYNKLYKSFNSINDTVRCSSLFMIVYIDLKCTANLQKNLDQQKKANGTI
jgi:hypothetical protein